METELEVGTTEGGETVYVDRTRGERGSKGPFFVVYTSPDRETRWGYVCGNCESFDNAMDSMGRLQCNVCGNLRKPDEWDAAHE
jgi:hypothetical protein